MTGGAPHGPATPAAARPATRRPAVPPGVIVVDKPTGVTSHDVVDVVRRRFREPQAGHLGTLDPGASGLLAVALGAATRCVTVWQGAEKTYEGTLLLGVTTSTQDTSGEVLATVPVTVSEEQIRAASAAFTGDLLQVPPMVSAVRVGGERLYRLARRGITVDRNPRRVRVLSWEWLGFELPHARFRVRCSSGTYVRTLAHDLGEALGCGAALQALRRLRSEPFDLSRAVTVRDLHELRPDEAWRRAGVALDEALRVLPALALEPAEAEAIGRGGGVPLAAVRADGLPAAGGTRSIVLRDGAGRALALGEIVARDDGPTARPNVVFPWAVREGRAIP